jgi:hypothetical protein
MPNQRQQLTQRDIDDALLETKYKLVYRLQQKGMGSYASVHEILGILKQELEEYNDAVHQRTSENDKVEELKDIAIAAIFGIASIRSGGIDW